MSTQFELTSGGALCFRDRQTIDKFVEALKDKPEVAERLTVLGIRFVLNPHLPPDEVVAVNPTLRPPCSAKSTSPTSRKRRRAAGRTSRG
jgi:hypothetical protein